MQPAADAKGVRMRSIVDLGTTPVAGDADRLQQVIWNLISNAVKFTPRGQQIVVRLRRVDQQVELAVSDTGVGIAPSFLPHIFERFRQADSRFSREHGGLGLGLAISRHIIEMHGGTIEAESAGVGKGATFCVRLPVMSAAAGLLPDEGPLNALVGAARAPTTRLDGIYVVAVDDDDDALEMVREILEGAGAEVTTAQSGADALEILKRRPPQALVCDIGMPGMDGFELIGRVRLLSRADGGGVPAAALTAYARSEDRTRALRAGFQMHLAKPIDPAELLDSVRALAGWDESLF
jgi:CheY-like chemotaxis protein